jgi:hypothetical protein
MSKLTTARDDAAKKFISSIEEVYRAALDRETEAGKLAALRARCREVAGIQCERLLTVSADCRDEVLQALQDALASKQEELSAANIACTKTHTDAVAAMEALYGSPGIDFAQRFQSVNEQAANALAFRMLDEKGRIELEIKAVTAYRENGTRDKYSVEVLAAMDSTAAACFAPAYLAAAVAGELVA